MSNPRSLVVGLIAALIVVAGLSPAPASAGNSIAAMNVVLSDVNLTSVKARDALEWLSVAAGFNLVVSWKNLEDEGYDPDSLVTLKLRDVPARTVLKLLLMDIFNDPNVIAEVTADYVHIRTKTAAGKDPVVRLYPIQDLLHEVPDFDGAPEFNLNAIAADDSSGGTSPFEDVSTDKEEGRLSTIERANQIADAIRASVETDIWNANGGQDGQITYYNGMLIIRAPAYVHQKIGIPGRDAVVTSPDDTAARTTTSTTPTRAAATTDRTAGVSRQKFGFYNYEYRAGVGVVGKSNGVSGIDWRQANSY